MRNSFALGLVAFTVVACGAAPGEELSAPVDEQAANLAPDDPTVGEEPETLTASFYTQVVVPKANATVSGTTVLSASAASAHGVARVDFFADGKLIGTAKDGGGFGYILSWDTRTVIDGAHVIWSRVTNTEGATKTSGMVGVTCANHRTRGSMMGMTAHINADGNGAEFDKMKALGVKWVRVSQEWQWLSSAPGKIDYTPYDKTVAMAKARGLKVLALAMGAPSWANGGHSDSGHYPPTATHMKDFAAYAAGLAARGADAIEIWNEPNNPSSFFRPKPDVNIWAEIVIASYPAIKAANPRIPVITGGMSPYGDLNDTSDPNVKTLAPVNYFKAAMAIPGFAHSFDAVGHHPYIYPGDPITSKIGWNALMQTALLEDVLEAKGMGSKEFWFTEYGNCTAPGVDRCLSESNAAAHYQRYLDGMTELVKSGVRLGPAFSYTLNDDDGVTREGSMGIFRKNGTTKPSYAVLRDAAKTLW